MAKVRTVLLARKGSSEKRKAIMLHNIKAYCGTIDENMEAVEKKIEHCIACDELSVRASCRKLGNCPSSRHEFYKYHINREKGVCPIGRF